MKTVFGGNRIGSGKKMTVEFEGYQRATFNLRKVVTCTASIGTVTPIYTNIGLPEDTWDVGMASEVYTNPTVGPLFGRIKGEYYWFTSDIRLYNSFLHNNKLRIGKNISQVKFPQMELTARPIDLDTVTNLDGAQVNPSSILAWLGVRGIGMAQATNQDRSFNAMGLLSYWDTIKNYYANQQENVGAVVHYGDITPTAQTVTNLKYADASLTMYLSIPISPGVADPMPFGPGFSFDITYAGATPDTKQIMINFQTGESISVWDLCTGAITFPTATRIYGAYNSSRWGTNLVPVNYAYSTNAQPQVVAPNIATFDLENIDLMREEILAFAQTSLPYVINSFGLPPYNWVVEQPNGIPNVLMAQEGLAVKTYLNDKFNNWVETESITYINNASAVTISGGKFTMDQLNFSKKMYDYLNRTAVMGGSWYDWVEASWDTNVMQKSEIPVFRGGMIKDVIFQERISTAATDTQPLATLAGIGRTARDQQGGRLVIKINEPCILQCMMSFTPRINYSQGNKWHVLLETMEDLFKPAFNQIGFQNDINEYRAWWTTNHNGADWVQTAAGFLPAWLEYQTDIDEAYGNFAYGMPQDFMVFLRGYQWEETAGNVQIQDLTTYIDPVRYNQVFAQTSLDAMNLWVQVGLDIECRRKMSAKIMPKV